MNHFPTAACMPFKHSFSPTYVKLHVSITYLQFHQAINYRSNLLKSIMRLVQVIRIFSSIYLNKQH